jgi:hypothetical protein
MQRKVKFGTKPWLKKNAKLPEIPGAVSQRYQAYVLEKVRALASAWRDDAEENGRAFDTPEAFYQALADMVITQGQADAKATGGDPWPKLKAAVDTAGNLTEVPWASFGDDAKVSLQAKLLECEVQVSSNTDTTACHANKHQKLPKKVVAPDGKELDELSTDQQPDYTPYIEFLLSGQKKATGIERGILDRDAGQIYLTAHYDQGSIAWLSGAPQVIVDDWREKARVYCQTLKGEV